MLRSWIKAPRHLVMDTIPLMLLLVGAYDRSYLTKFKRLKSYGYKKEDFEILKKFLLSTNTITVTPGVLVEAANFLENDSNFSEIIMKNMSLLAKLNEVYIEKTRILKCELVFQLAFTDTSLLLLAKKMEPLFLLATENCVPPARRSELTYSTSIKSYRQVI